MEPQDIMKPRPEPTHRCVECGHEGTDEDQCEFCGSVKVVEIN